MGAKRLYITCPVCGKTMCKASQVEQIEVKCPVCKSELLSEVSHARKVSVEIIKEGVAPA